MYFGLGMVVYCLLAIDFRLNQPVFLHKQHLKHMLGIHSSLPSINILNVPLGYKVSFLFSWLLCTRSVRMLRAPLPLFDTSYQLKLKMSFEAFNINHTKTIN